jgi:hypothetical protein
VVRARAGFGAAAGRRSGLHAGALGGGGGRPSRRLRGDAEGYVGLQRLTFTFKNPVAMFVHENIGHQSRESLPMEQAK